MKKKSYNPLKMWTSYVFATIGFIFGYTRKVCFDTCATNILFLGIAFASLGFLVGWATHLLIRSLNK